MDTGNSVVKVGAEALGKGRNTGDICDSVNNGNKNKKQAE